MSEQAAARKRSRRSPPSAEETVAPSVPEEAAPPAAAEAPADPQPDPALDPKPDSTVDPKSAPSYRFAMAAVIILGALIVIGVGVLVVGIVKGWGHQSGTPAAAAAAPSKPVSMSLAPGFRILSNDTQPGRLILHVRSDTVDEIDIIDLNDGRVVAQIHAQAPK